MRNKATLYIEGSQADLDNGSFLLLNYTAEDLSNPTIVKNSFSRQITLKGTPRNDEIFGHIYRNDRVTAYGTPYTGPNFDPARKTEFVIYNEMNEILESGYLKLDEVVTNRKGHSYKVTLFGGLGSFLYGLSYDAQGNKRTLADLDFGETLDFVINAATVREAWDRIIHGTGSATKWDILNFIPSYLGLPPAPFDANKCLVHAVTTGLQYRDEDYGTNPNGFVLVTLNDKVTGNDAKDYRSYLQKPVIKMSAIINAICDTDNNGGYTVNLDPDFFYDFNPYWKNTWLTLPLFNDLNINETTTETTQTMTALDTILPIASGGGSGLYKVTVNAQPYADMTGLVATDYKLWCRNSAGVTMNLFVVKLTLYDSSQNVLTEASYGICTDGITFANLPTPDFTFDHIDGTNGAFVDAGGNRVTFPIYAEAESAAYYKVEIDCRNYYYGQPNANPGDQSWKMWFVGESVLTNGVRFAPTITSAQVDVVGVSSSTVRTGATITKAMLLGGGQTPADYFLSYCKMFGLQLLKRKGEKVIDVLMRKNLYNGSTIDISGRIDRGRDITKRPFSFAAKWYLFGNDAKGEFAEYYRSKYGRPFGQFRVNTGYGFDAEQKLMTGDIVFNNFASVMEASKYFCELTYDTRNIPAVFLAGGKYALNNGSETKTLDLPNFYAAAKTWDNPAYPMMDEWAKVQFHGPQNAHIDERDTIVFYGGREDASAKHLSLTDDTEDMLALNGNNPCWLPNYCDIRPSAKIDELPHFSRYYWSGTTINLQLDWGDPEELQIPGYMLGTYSSIFPAYWEKYIADRYDDDSAVLTAYVDLRGLRVDESMLRNFYAFDGALWALNRIIDYSLTTSGPTKCEFVKVQDITNYTTL